jgi:hypothetical protein
MSAAALDAMKNVLDLAPSDAVLVVGDRSAGVCPEAFAVAAATFGCSVDRFQLPEQDRPLKNLPAGMIDLLDGKSVVINTIAGLSDETPFRLKWLGEIEARGLRLGHCPGIVDGMFVDGPMAVDYQAMRDAAARLRRAFVDADTVSITTELGTDIRLGISGRHFVDDVHVSDTEKGCNLPCGEVYCCPHTADGVFVCDGCFGGDGNVSSPVTIRCEQGRVTEVSCDDPELAARVRGLMDTDDGSGMICELGIGLNPGARLIGNMLEDEKALRTGHIAFGSNIGMPGGTNASTMHIDYLFHRPTITVTRTDGSTMVVLRDGDAAV